MVTPTGLGADKDTSRPHQGTSSDGSSSPAEKQITWLERNAARVIFPVMFGLSVGAFVLAYPDPSRNARWWLSLAIFLVLSGFPSWLYLRFLTIKLTPIYREFVHSLHRLGIDDPGNLPRPLESSPYFAQWKEARDRRGGIEDQRKHANLYDQKFVSYFGSFDKEARFSGLGSLLPVIAAWIAFAAGWLAIISNPAFVYPGTTLDDTIRFGFLGAYVFSLQLTVRAFFQNDLRSGTYVGIVERLVVVTIFVLLIFVVWTEAFDGGAQASLAVVAFVVGSFPLVGQEWLSQVAASALRNQVPSVASRHPLSDIDGMNVWYQARLLEEGIEDIQNLATANIVDVVMHSRAPVGRIVDWIDQAVLRQHLPPTQRKADHPHPSDAVLLETLNALGVRTATDLLELYAPLSDESVEMLNRDLHALEPADPPDKAYHHRMLDVVRDEQQRAVVGLRMLGILRCLGSEPNLRYVLNWQMASAGSALAESVVEPLADRISTQFQGDGNGSEDPTPPSRPALN